MMVLHKAYGFRKVFTNYSIQCMDHCYSRARLKTSIISARPTYKKTILTLLCMQLRIEVFDIIKIDYARNKIDCARINS